MTTTQYSGLRDRIAVWLCNVYRYPATSLDSLMGWTPMFQRHADELIGMVQQGIDPEPRELEEDRFLVIGACGHWWQTRMADPGDRFCEACQRGRPVTILTTWDEEPK